MLFHGIGYVSAMQRKTALKSVWGLDLLSSLSFPRFLYIFSPDISKVGHPLPSGPWEARKGPFAAMLA